MPNKLLDASPTQRAWDTVNARRLRQANIRGLSGLEAFERGLGVNDLTSQEVQRALRNAQSRISKDIKATERELGKATGDTVVNLSKHLGELKSLQSDMKKIKTVNGTRMVNTSTSRTDAMVKYLSYFAGKKARDNAARGVVPRIYFGRQAQRFNVDFRRKYDFDVDRDDARYSSDYRLQDLFDDYEEAILAGDSDEAREIMARIKDYVGDYYETGNRR